MHRKPWDELTDLQRREAIALRLGWNSNHGRNCWNPGPCWHPNGWERHLRSRLLPNWPTNDALAFTEVWPKLLMRPEAHLLTMGPDGRPSVLTMRSVHYFEEAFFDNAITGDTWAEAICRAAYELLPVEQSVEEIGATK